MRYFKVTWFGKGGTPMVNFVADAQLKNYESGNYSCLEVTEVDKKAYDNYNYPNRNTIEAALSSDNRK